MAEKVGCSPRTPSLVGRTFPSASAHAVAAGVAKVFSVGYTGTDPTRLREDPANNICHRQTFDRTALDFAAFAVASIWQDIVASVSLVAVSIAGDWEGRGQGRKGARRATRWA